MTNQAPPTRVTKEPSYADAIIPLVVLIVLIAASAFLFGNDAIDGPLQVSLLLSAMIAGLVILKNGHPWEEVSAASGRAISSVISAIFILLSFGAVIGTWNMSGTIPTLVDYGIRLLQPSWFYMATAGICAAIAVSIGSSWTTAGTIGVGLVGIATMVGVSPVITAGAVISGAYFGDKTSPLVPWNSCGAYMAATLGVSTFLYLPFCIFNIASPLLSLAYGLTGFKITRMPPDTGEKDPPTA